MISVEQQQQLLVQIGNNLSKEIIVYAIGGTAMIFLGFKDATKDIDLVFTDKKELEEFKSVAILLGYKKMDAIQIYGVRNNSPQMINLGDSRFDLFHREVIDFIFSENMEKRAIQIHQFGKNLKLKIADKHDIVIMKCATRRTKDEEDIINIVKSSSLDWKIIIEEAKSQVNLGKESAFLDMGRLVEKLIYTHKLKISKEIHNTFFALLQEQAEKKQKI